MLCKRESSRGTLHVLVRSADGLPPRAAAAAATGLYVVAALSADARRTRVASVQLRDRRDRRTRAPVWEEAIAFHEAPLSEALAGGLVLTVCEEGADGCTLSHGTLQHASARPRDSHVSARPRDCNGSSRPHVVSRMVSTKALACGSYVQQNAQPSTAGDGPPTIHRHTS